MVAGPAGGQLYRGILMSARVKGAPIPRVVCAECGVLEHNMNPNGLKSGHEAATVHSCYFFAQPRNVVQRGTVNKRRS